MASCSDMDLSTLHPPSSDRSPQPLHSLLLWDCERLRRVGRWKSTPENPGKEVLRCYARTILALQELQEAAMQMPQNSSVSAGIPNLKFTGGEDAPPAPVVLKSAIRTKRAEATGSVAVTTGRQIRWKPPVGIFKRPLAPPAAVIELLESWLGHARLFGTVVMMFLTWLPPVMLIMALVLLFSDPLLAMKILWRGASCIPQSLQAVARDYVAEPMRVSNMPSVTGHEIMPTLSSPATLLPTDNPSHCSVSTDSGSSYSSLAVMLFAGEGGAVLSLLAAFRAGLLQIGGGAPP